MKYTKGISRVAVSAFVGAVIGVSAIASAATFDLSPEQSGRPRAGVDQAAVHAVPSSFKFAKSDTLTVAIGAYLPPLSTYATDARTVVGFDPDLAQLVADSLGRKLKIVPVAWADWPLALESGKVDVVLYNVTVTEERKEKFDFSTYRRDQLGFYVKANGKIAAIREPKDVAGLRVITDAGTNQEKILLDWDRQNIAHGLKPISIQYYDDYATAGVALQAGRADAIFSVNAQLAYQAALQQNIRLVGTVNGGWPRTADIAIASRKGSGLAEPLTLVLNDLIKDGKYRQVLERWSLASEAIDKAQTNPPGLPKQ